MKVFVYTKEQKPRKVATITDVVNVYTVHGENTVIHVVTDSGADFTFNTKAVKTTIYQN